MKIGSCHEFRTSFSWHVKSTYVWADFPSINWQNKVGHWSFESPRPCEKVLHFVIHFAFLETRGGKVEDDHNIQRNSAA